MTEQQLTRLHTLANSVSPVPVEPAAAPFAHATGAVVLFSAGTQQLIGKIHRSSTRHEQEVHAYRNWAPALGEAAPQLLTTDPSLPGIVLTHVPGTPLDTLEISPQTERLAHQQAGTLLQQLHQLPAPDRPSEITAGLADRAEQWLGQIGQHLKTRDMRLVRDHMRQLHAMRTPRVGPCHLDFQPRNLLWHDQHVRLIDFEHSRVDLAARDLVRLATRCWPQRPDLKTAVLAGYGPLTDSDMKVLTHCTALEAATSLAYAIRHNDSHAHQHAQHLLDTLPAA